MSKLHDRCTLRWHHECSALHLLLSWHIVVTLHHILVNDLSTLDLEYILRCLCALRRTLDHIVLCHRLLLGLPCMCNCDLHSSIYLLRMLTGLTGEDLRVVARLMFGIDLLSSIHGVSMLLKVFLEYFLSKVRDAFTTSESIASWRGSLGKHKILSLPIAHLHK